jgi:CubicO group peptidase (beta-lactamase class C family)
VSDTLGWAPIGALVRNSAGGPTFPGSIGEYSWGGYGGTYFIVDPREKLIAIRMSQAPWSRSYDNRIFRVMLYSALE